MYEREVADARRILDLVRESIEQAETEVEARLAMAANPRHPHHELAAAQIPLLLPKLQQWANQVSSMTRELAQLGDRG